MIEKYFFTVIYAINKCRHYIIGYEVFIHNDQYDITYLMNKPIMNDRITRWLLLLLEFNITIMDKLGKENQVANFPSRLDNKDDNIHLDDSFLDENLFMFDILKSCHNETCRGHFVVRRKAYKVLHSRYYWRTLFQDVKKYVWGCNGFQRMGRQVPANEIPL